MKGIARLVMLCCAVGTACGQEVLAPTSVQTETDEYTRYELLARVLRFAMK